MEQSSWARVEFAGDVFEMEDQRNWTDASYKTYSTPLEIPYPVEVTRGTTIAQSLAVSVISERAVASTGTNAGEPVRLKAEPDAELIPIPGIGAGVPQDADVADDAREILRRLAPDFLRHDVVLSRSDWQDQLAKSGELARDLNSRLQIAVYVSPNTSRHIAELIDQLRTIVVASCLVLSARHWVTDHQDLEVVCSSLRSEMPELKIGLGADTNFTELNRARPDAMDADFIEYAINPQVHAFDDSSLMETLPTQAATVRSAKALYPDKPISVGTITLLPRFNSTIDPDPERRVLAPVDHRQRSLFLAAWTAGSIGYLSGSGADRLTYFDLVGQRGIVGGSSPYPAYHVLRDVLEVSGGQLVPLVSSRPAALTGMRVRGPASERTIVTCIAASETRVVVEGIGRGSKSRILSHRTVDRVVSEPESWRTQMAPVAVDSVATVEFDLPPYSVVTIDSALE